MRRILPCVLALFVLTGLAPMAPVRAEVLAPGTYRGWVVQDRWGDVLLANGAFLLRFHGHAKATALAWKDKSVEVVVTKFVAADLTSGAIGAVSDIRAHPSMHAGALKVELRVPEMCPPMRRQMFDVNVRYTGSTRFHLDTRKLQVMVRRIGPPLPNDAMRRGPAFLGRNPRGSPWHAGGSSMTVIEPGKRVRHEEVLKAPGGALEAEGALTYRAVLMMDLPPGAYEIVAFLAGADFSGPPAPRSKPLRLDVVPPRSK